MFYRNIEELLKEIDYYLNHEAERKRIACLGGRFVNSHYSLKQMIRAILS